MRSLEFTSIVLNESRSYVEATSRTILVEHASPGGSNGHGTVLEVGRRKLTRPRGSAPLALTTWFRGDEVTNR